MEVLEPTIGSDVEYFLKDISKKRIISAEGIIKGSKYDPFHFDSNNSFYATSLDNILAEGNIPPTKSSEEFNSALEKLRNYINSICPKGVTTEAIGGAEVNPEYLETDNARMLGCDPSFCAWNLQQCAPTLGVLERRRGAGFHIHIGYKEPSEEKNIALVKALDIFLGVPSVILDTTGEDRKRLGYGQAGNFRNQDHGVEYRTLSSFMASTESLRKWCFDNTQLAIKFVNDGLVEKLSEYTGPNIQQTIDDSVREQALIIIKDFNVPMP